MLFPPVVGDGRQGYPEEAPYDAIHVGAAAATVPKEVRVIVLDVCCCGLPASGAAKKLIIREALEAASSVCLIWSWQARAFQGVVTFTAWLTSVDSFFCLS